MDEHRNEKHVESEWERDPSSIDILREKEDWPVIGKLDNWVQSPRAYITWLKEKKKQEEQLTPQREKSYIEKY